MINYKEIIDNLNTEKVKQLLEKLGVENIIESDTYLITNTICHNEDAHEASMKLYYYKNTHIFYCYTSCQGMSIFNLLEHYYETRGIEYDWFHDVLEVVEDCANFKGGGFVVPKYQPIREKFNQELVTLPTFPNGIINCYTTYYPIEWLTDGITKEAMDKFNIRYDSINNRIIIPHYNVNSELVGIRGRALNQWDEENIGKYFPVQIEGRMYSHPLSLNLYGLNYNKENIKKKGVCYICEAEKAVMQAEQFGEDNCVVAVCGSQLNKNQVRLLFKTAQPKEVVLCFDKEQDNNSFDYFNKLYGLCKRYNNYCDFSFVYDKKGLLNLKDSPTDRGREIFEELIKERVKVRI